MCGIYGMVSAKGRKKFNYPLFCTLGINNDTRGGDSCGVFIDGKVEYGIDKKKLFLDFYHDSKLLSETKTYQIAIGHDRKASIGPKTEKQAHPIVIRNPKTGEAKFVVIHNGTIFNYKELAKKYIPDVNIEGMTDSQVMTNIFYYKGYDVLSEYQGGSVFFIVDYRQPTPKVLMWKGASKRTEYSKDMTVERPFYVSLGKDDMVFSSIPDFIGAFRPDIEVLTIKENNLIEYRDGDLWIVEAYDRTKVTQEKPTITYYGGGGYDGYWENGVWHSGTKGIKNFSVGGASAAGSITKRSYVTYDEKNNIYKAEGSPLHGKCYINSFGWSTPGKEALSKEYWFFHGVLLKTEDCFKLLEDYQKKSKMDPTKFLEKHMNLIRYVSVDGLYFKNDVLVKATNIYNYSVYSGVMTGLNSSYNYNYDMGKYVSKVWTSSTDKNHVDIMAIKESYDIPKLRKKLC